MEWTSKVGFSALDSIKSSVFELFETCFSRSYPEHLWIHFFRDAVGRDSFATCAYEGEKLVAFGAVVPFRVVGVGEDEVFYGGTNVCVMIDPEARLGGATYINLYKELKKTSRSLLYDFLLAFPNENARLPLRRLARFEDIDRARFVEGRVSQEYMRFLTDEAKKIFLDSDSLEWRMARHPYGLQHGEVTKLFMGNSNLIDMLSQDSTVSFEGVFPLWEGANIKVADAFPTPDKEVYLCGFNLSGRVNFRNLKRSLLFSDVY